MTPFFTIWVQKCLTSDRTGSENRKEAIAGVVSFQTLCFSGLPPLTSLRKQHSFHLFGYCQVYPSQTGREKLALGIRSEFSARILPVTSCRFKISPQHVGILELEPLMHKLLTFLQLRLETRNCNATPTTTKQPQSAFYVTKKLIIRMQQEFLLGEICYEKKLKNLLISPNGHFAPLLLKPFIRH